MKNAEKKELKNTDKDSLPIMFIRGLGSFLTTLIVIIAAALVVILVLKFTGLSLYTVESGSMEPSLPTNSLVIVKPAEFEEIETGDVITYKMSSADIYVTHRVAEINEDGESFITKGDANTDFDASPVQYEDVIGVVLIGIPKLGAVLYAVTRYKSVFIAIIVLLFVFSILWDAIINRRMKRKYSDPINTSDCSGKCTQSVDSEDTQEADNEK